VTQSAPQSGAELTTQISFRDVSKVYQTASGPVTALQHINLDVKPGEIFAVIGYSGAGKSTLVRLINGLEKVTDGHVVVNGFDVTNMSEHELRAVRPEIGMIFQQFNLMSAKTVYDNIAYPLRLAKWSKTDIKKRITELLSFVGLTEKAWVHPDELSGGQKQRVGIARALATKPSVLLADESTSALDPETTQDVLGLLRRVNEKLGVTIVVITHEMEVVRAIADRVAVLDTGKLIEQGPVDKIFEVPATETSKRFVNTIMRHNPSSEEWERLERENPDAALVSVKSVDPAEFGAALARITEAGRVNFAIVQGGVVQVKTRSIGSFTLALRGEPAAVEAARGELGKISHQPDDHEPASPAHVTGADVPDVLINSAPGAAGLNTGETAAQVQAAINPAGDARASSGTTQDSPAEAAENRPSENREVRA
jgi:D-methionine transport system ATP-binding protein